jgi:hypothetical protein
MGMRIPPCPPVRPERPDLLLLPTGFASPSRSLFGRWCRLAWSVATRALLGTGSSRRVLACVDRARSRARATNAMDSSAARDRVRVRVRVRASAVARSVGSGGQAISVGSRRSQGPFRPLAEDTEEMACPPLPTQAHAASAPSQSRCHHWQPTLMPMKHIQPTNHSFPKGLAIPTVPAHR